MQEVRRERRGAALWLTIDREARRNALNDGGGVASLRIDPQGKAFAQMLMDLPAGIPRALADQLALNNR